MCTQCSRYRDPNEQIQSARTGTEEEVPHPEPARELRWLLAWLNGIKRSLSDSSAKLEESIESLKSRLFEEYLRNGGAGILQPEDPPYTRNVGTMALPELDDDLGAA